MINFYLFFGLSQFGVLEHIMTDTIAQFGVAFFGVIAIILVSRKNKWGFVFGLLSQPFWFITSYENKQWGVLILTAIYTISWSYGIYEWFRPKKTAQAQ